MYCAAILRGKVRMVALTSLLVHRGDGSLGHHLSRRSPPVEVAKPPVPRPLRHIIPWPEWGRSTCNRRPPKDCTWRLRRQAEQRCPESSLPSPACLLVLSRAVTLTAREICPLQLDSRANRAAFQAASQAGVRPSHHLHSARVARHGRIAATGLCLPLSRCRHPRRENTALAWLTALGSQRPVPRRQTSQYLLGEVPQLNTAPQVLRLARFIRCHRSKHSMKTCLASRCAPRKIPRAHRPRRRRMSRTIPSSLAKVCPSRS